MPPREPGARREPGRTPPRAPGRRRPAALPATLLASLTLALAACGGDGERAGRDISAPVAATSPAPATSPAATTPAESPGPGTSAEPELEPIELAEPVAALRPRVEQQAISGAATVIATPHERDELRTAVIFTHGYGEPHHYVLTSTPQARVGAALLEAGAIVAASEAGGPAWGTPESVADYRALRAELVRRGARRIAILASSMGGVAGLQLLPQADTFAGIYPVCDLRAMAGEGRFERAAIVDAWGDEPLPAALSPVRLTREEIIGKPMAFWASPADTLVPKDEQTDRCADRYRRAGARVRVTTTTGDHGDPSNFDGPAVVRVLLDD